MTLALVCRLLTPSYCTSFADEPWYDDQCIVHSLVLLFLVVIANLGVQKCSHPLAPRDQKLNVFEAEWITCGCICTVRKEAWKYCCGFVGIESQKLIFRGVTRWLSLYRSLPRMLQLYPSSNSYFMSIDKPTVILKRFFGNSLSDFCSH